MKNSSSENNFPQLNFCCQEKWSDMSSRENGRFCNKCEKVVSDFSAMNTEEILQAINHSQSENSCGRFQAHQLQNPFGDRRDRVVGFYQRIILPSTKRTFLKSVQLGLAMVLLFVTGCHRRLSGFYAPPSRKEIRKEKKLYRDSFPDEKGKTRVHF